MMDGKSNTEERGNSSEARFTQIWGERFGTSSYVSPSRIMDGLRSQARMMIRDPDGLGYGEDMRLTQFLNRTRGLDPHAEILLALRAMKGDETTFPVAQVKAFAHEILEKLPEGQFEELRTEASEIARPVYALHLVPPPFEPE